MKNYVKEGDVMDYTNGVTALVSGEVVVLAGGIGIAATDIAANEVGPLVMEGVFKLAKKSGDTFAQGAKLYWDATPGELTTTSAGNTLCGYAEEAAGSSDVLALVNLKYMSA